MPTLTTFITFDDQAEEAVRYYLSVFEDGKIIPRSAGRALQAMLKMVKLDIAELQRAHDGN